MDVLILLVVLLLQLFDRPILLGLNLGDLQLALRFHVFSQTRHLSLVLFLDFAGDPLILLAFLSGQRVEVLGESVTIFGLTNFLLLLLHFECA